MLSLRFLLSAAALFPAAALAQTPGSPQVPPIQPAAWAPPPSEEPLAPPIPLVNQAPVRLSPQERAGVYLANRFASSPQMPAEGDNGAVVFLFGAELPSVVCAPLYVCDIALQPGEVVNDVNIGDGVRWKISPSVSGTGPDKVTHVLVKPIDSGLTTNLNISTDRRTYTIELVSTQKQWMPQVAFSYPDDIKKAWAAYEQQETQSQASYQAANVLSTGQNLATLDFNYRVSGGDPAWRPLRVYSDGTKTYIQLPSSTSSADLPALVALGNDGGIFTSPSTQIVNYRIEGTTYVVDKVLSRAELIAGVGASQSRVIITHATSGS